jgi:threonyl-tRNA synthetase
VLEKYRGRLPLWLAPVQICVLPVEAAQDDPARALVDDLCAAGLRAQLEPEGSLGARIRASRQRRDCLIAVIGAAEAAAGQVQVTDVAAGFRGKVGRGRLLDAVQRAYAARARHIEWP